MRSISGCGRNCAVPDQNVFTLTFAALSYANPATNRYRYKLEGLQEEWNEVGSDRRQATYTTLPSATYTFRVQAATSRGAWSEPGIALRGSRFSPVVQKLSGSVSRVSAAWSFCCGQPISSVSVNWSGSSTPGWKRASTNGRESHGNYTIPCCKVSTGSCFASRRRPSVFRIAR